MPAYCDDLLDTAKWLLARRPGQRGKLPVVRVRRSISTSYYALFHFLLDEAGARLVGTHHDLRRQRHVLARSFTHTGVRAALDKVRGSRVDASVQEFMGGSSDPAKPLPTPPFARLVARAFSEAWAKRNDADYDLNEVLTLADADAIWRGNKNAIATWRAAKSEADRDFKKMLCLLMLLKGQLRRE